jgi:hypothetical protein
MKNDYLLISLIMKAVSTSETSVNFYETTRRNILLDSLLHTRHSENLKCHNEDKVGGTHSTHGKDEKFMQHVR